MRLRFHTSLALFSLLTFELGQAIKIASIGAVGNNAMALQSPDLHHVPALSQLDTDIEYTNDAETMLAQTDEAEIKKADDKKDDKKKPDEKKPEEKKVEANVDVKLAAEKKKEE